MRAIPIFQDLRPGRRRLPSGRLRRLDRRRCQRGIASGCDLVVLSKFGKLESIGQGLNSAFKAALAAGVGPDHGVVVADAEIDGLRLAAVRQPAGRAGADRHVAARRRCRQPPSAMTCTRRASAPASHPLDPPRTDATPRLWSRAPGAGAAGSIEQKCDVRREGKDRNHHGRVQRHQRGGGASARGRGRQGGARRRRTGCARRDRRRYQQGRRRGRGRGTSTSPGATMSLPSSRRRRAASDACDVLVSNAGLMPLSPLDALKVDEWERR